MVDCLGEGCGLPYASADDSTFTLRGQTVHRHMHADLYPPTPRQKKKKNTHTHIYTYKPQNTARDTHTRTRRDM